MAELTSTGARPERSGLRNTWASKKFQDRLVQVGATLLCLLGVLIILFPVAWMISTSLKTRFEAVQFPPTWIPNDPQWNNYRDALTLNNNPFARYFANTLYYAGAVMIAETVSCAFIAYGFARLRAPGKDVLFLLVLATLMLPSQVTLIPQYVLFARMDRANFLGLDWINSYNPLIIPHLFGSSYLIFLLRQFYRGLPKDYEEAAILDSALPANLDEDHTTALVARARRPWRSSALCSTTATSWVRCCTSPTTSNTPSRWGCSSSRRPSEVRPFTC
ncbi:MAG: carbohydrate ABC transporter permease [Chloroflexia bacterium]